MNCKAVGFNAAERGKVLFNLQPFTGLHLHSTPFKPCPVQILHRSCLSFKSSHIKVVLCELLFHPLMLYIAYTWINLSKNMLHTWGAHVGFNLFSGKRSDFDKASRLRIVRVTTAPGLWTLDTCFHSLCRLNFTRTGTTWATYDPRKPFMAPKHMAFS